MQALDFSGNPNCQWIAAAYRTKAKEIAFPRGEIRSGKAAKIAFVRIGVSAPFVVDAIEVDDFGLQTVCFQHSGEAQDADWSQLAHDASRIRLTNQPVAELVGRGCADEADFHLCHLLGPVQSGSDVYYERRPLRSPVYSVPRILSRGGPSRVPSH